MTSCPVCNKPVDPIRARYVAVRAGRVVAYCSPECRDAPDGRPAVPAVATPVEESGPVIEIVREPASGAVVRAKGRRDTPPKPIVVTTPDVTDGIITSGGNDAVVASGELADPSRKRPPDERKDSIMRDTGDSKAGWDWLDEEPAQHAQQGTRTDGERKSRWPMLLLAVVLVGGAGIAVWKLVLDKPAVSSAPAPSSTPVVTDASIAVAPDAAPVTKAAALQQATEVLRKYVQEGSPRVQRLAAGALGRTGDPVAVAALQQAVKQEKVPAARFKLAYELARAGDKSGREALVAGLALPDRSDKLDAATRLANLGDDRAKPLLSSLL
ncbi:MAG TPA: HEAT repeat domain-containing protein, partial [Kofleriaceae bacterium]|nr:HEAT repeat domain-containing protein [Kofleriaceae bacterium]